MNEEEYRNRLDIFEQLIKSIEEENIGKIKELSNRTIHSATINQDTESINIAIIVYAISKIIERKKYRQYPEWPEFYEKLKFYVEECHKSLKQKNFEMFRENLMKIGECIKILKGNLREYIEFIFRKAKINKGSRIYEHGISFTQTAEILGISLWELAEYVGQTGIGNVELSITKDVKERIKILEKVFE
jgi:predicted RNA-binding protein